MSRRRKLSTDISTDAKVAELGEVLPMLLYTWAIAHADDWGRLTGNPRQFKLLVCPGIDNSTAEIDEALTKVEQAGLWYRYEVEGEKYLAYPRESWFKHQSYINESKRYSDAGSEIPPPPTEVEYWQESARNSKKQQESARNSASPSPSPSPSQDVARARDPHHLVLLAREEVPDWQPDDEKDEALIERHLKRLDADTIERTILRLADYQHEHGKYKQLRTALSKWLMREEPNQNGAREGPPDIVLTDEEIAAYNRVWGEA